MIESVNNEKIKYYAKLNQKKFRDETGLFIIEGEHLVEEAKRIGLVEIVFSIIDYPDSIKVSEAVMAKLSGLTNIPKVLGVARKPLDDKIEGNILVLDDIQDPGNLGTIIRSAVAFGIKTIVASNNTVDYYNLKTIRASEGMIFTINLVKRNLQEFLLSIKDDYYIYNTNVKNGTDVSGINLHEPYALIMGNEGAGVSEDVQSLADENVYIPISHECESLNVAMATSIILYEFSKKRA